MWNLNSAPINALKHVELSLQLGVLTKTSFGTTKAWLKKQIVL